MEHFFKIAVNAPLFELLTYSYPEKLPVGTAVLVPLGKRQVQGVIIEEEDSVTETRDFKVKPIAGFPEELPLLPSPFLSWAKKLAQYYHHPLGVVLQTAFPPLKKKGRATKRAVVPQLPQQSDMTLTAEQAAVVENVSLDGFSTHLIHGITGSGKTEVYMHLLRQVLANGRTGLVMVPEIALTPQLIHRFAERFGDQISVIHSQLTPREKTNNWWEIVEGKTKVLIGARSALFCPIPNLGIIFVDEEHESSYKQDEKFRYNGRDAAVLRGSIENVPVVLGSATPSLESYQNALAGKYKYHSMASRAKEQRLPEVTVIDLRAQSKDQSNNPAEKYNSDIPFWMSPQMFEKMSEYLNSGQQVACFLNRRGMAQSTVCTNCGHQNMCPDCDIHLTLHSSTHLVCHYCGYSQKFVETCSECGDGHMEPLGLGTERVEEDLAILFPEKVIQRMDRDEVTDRTTLEDIVEKIEKREIDILVGTQMISKGLDFENLNFVAVVLADVAMNMPDFRSSERSFQLLTQVAGRAGRHHKGEVLIQTFNPSHLAVEYAKNHDYLSFAEKELEFRKELSYPPFSKIASFHSSSLEKTSSWKAIDRLCQRAEALKEKYEAYQGIQILGPVEAPMFKLRNKYRYLALLKCPETPQLSQFIKSLLGDKKWVPTKAKVSVDVDPLNMM